MDGKLLSVLLKAKQTWLSSKEIDDLNNEMVSAFLSEWSESPDNVETSSYLHFGQVFNRDTEKFEQGLISKSQNELISDILWTAFGDSEIPEEVSRSYPRLEQEEWNQIIRIAQIALSLFDSHKKNTN